MNTLPTNLSTLPVIIIAGGHSRRLQLGDYQRKWQLPFGNSTLLGTMLDIASQVSATVVINGAKSDEDKLSDYSYPVIVDDEAQGPLSGLLRALKWGNNNTHPAIITLTCDTPFIPSDWLRHLEQSFKRSDRLACISRHQQKYHPLCGIWSTQLIDDLSRFMASHEKKAVHRWAKAHAEIVDFDACQIKSVTDTDPFININTAEEYRRAQMVHQHHVFEQAKHINRTKKME